MTDITAASHLSTRRHRTYPRAVKRTRRNGYPARQPGDNRTRHNGPPGIRLLPQPKINLS